MQGFEVDEFLSPKRINAKNDPFIWYGMAAAVDALNDSGSRDYGRKRSPRLVWRWAPASAGLHTIAENHLKLLNGGVRKVSPFFIPASIINMTSGQVSIFEKITGPNVSIVTACATSTHCIGLAGRSIEHGDADVMLAGGCGVRDHAIGDGRFLLGACDVDAQRGSKGCESAVRHRPRRIRDE